MVQIKQKRGTGVESPSPRSFSGGLIDLGWPVLRLFAELPCVSPIEPAISAFEPRAKASIKFYDSFLQYTRNVWRRRTACSREDETRK